MENCHVQKLNLPGKFRDFNPPSQHVSKGKNGSDDDSGIYKM